VGLDDAAGYVEVLDRLRSENPGEVQRLRCSGYETVGRHTLDHEKERFGEFVDRLTSRLDRLSAGGKPAHKDARR
jgi:predicted RecB family endonuclease